MDSTGYTKLPNELFDWLLAKSSVLSKRELVVMLVVIRNTTGWNREKSTISCRFIEQATGIANGHVCQTIKALEERGFLAVDRSKRTAVISINPTATKSVAVEPDCYRNGSGNATETVATSLPNQQRSSYQIGSKQIQEIQNKEKGKTQLAEWLVA